MPVRVFGAWRACVRACVHVRAAYARGRRREAADRHRRACELAAAVCVWMLRLAYVRMHTLKSPEHR